MILCGCALGTILSLATATAGGQNAAQGVDDNPQVVARPTAKQRGAVIKPEPVNVAPPEGRGVAAIPRGGLQAVPTVPAPEVVRLWSPEVAAGVKLTSSMLATVADLDSREFARREAASVKLADSSVTVEEIFAVLVRGDLSEEQVERLLSAAQTKVMSLPRGALGLRMQPSGDLAHPGVEVILLIPKMPAEKVLKLGDRIEKIDGRPIASSTDLVEIIQSKLPGEMVRLAVARPLRDERGRQRLDDDRQLVEEFLTFDVPLASATELEQYEDLLSPQSRSVIVERRLLALRQAHERFAPVGASITTVQVADRDARARPEAPQQPTKAPSPTIPK